LAFNQGSKKIKRTYPKPLVLWKFFNQNYQFFQVFQILEPKVLRFSKKIKRIKCKALIVFLKVYEKGLLANLFPTSSVVIIVTLQMDNFEGIVRRDNLMGNLHSIEVIIFGISL